MFCKSFGMELLMLETIEEYNNFTHILNTSYRSYLETHTHIGGTKEGREYWYWASTGKRIDYQLNWHAGQPDNAGGVEFCMDIVNSSNGIEINDLPCFTETYLFRFICEKTQKKNESDFQTTNKIKKKVSNLNAPDNIKFKHKISFDIELSN